jgi:hypothetical protein
MKIQSRIIVTEKDPEYGPFLHQPSLRHPRSEEDHPLQEQDQVVYVSCRECEPAAMDCAPAPSIASSVAENVNPMWRPIAVNLSPTAHPLCARHISIASR